MSAKRLVSVVVAVGCLGGFTALGSAQQPSTQSPPSNQPAGGAAAGKGGTIDCPASAAQSASRSQGATTNQASGAGNPQGVGSGSGLSALPSEGAPKRIDGAIKTIGSTRTNRVVEVGDVKLEVEPSTVILVNCKPASVADLKVGSQIKATYESKEPNRLQATVIEAQR
jgi:hypothetical protein